MNDTDQMVEGFIFPLSQRRPTASRFSLSGLAAATVRRVKHLSTDPRAHRAGLSIIPETIKPDFLSLELG